MIHADGTEVIIPIMTLHTVRSDSIDLVTVIDGKAHITDNMSNNTAENSARFKYTEFKNTHLSLPNRDKAKNTNICVVLI